jgi:hypothetical protein
VDDNEGDDMALTFGLLATLRAKPGKELELADFLVQGQALDGRQAHLNGQIPQALGQVGPDLLAADPDIKPVGVLASKP